jgi:drug/metabolite transporter (DMT)-like permease
MIYLLSLLSGILYGSNALINKKLSSSPNNPIITSLLINVFSSIFCIFFIAEDIFSKNFLVSFDGFDWLLLIAAGIITTFAFYGQFLALEHLPASEQALLSRVSLLTSTLGGILLLGETTSGIKLVGIVLVLIGIIVSSIRQGKFVYNKWVFVQIFTSMGFGLSILIDKVVSPHFSSGIYVFISAFTTALGLLLLAKSKNVLKGMFSFKKSYYGFALLASFLAISAYYVVIRVYGMGGNVVIVTALTQIKLPLIIFGGYYIYGEKNDLPQKIIGVITVLAGIILLKY